MIDFIMVVPETLNVLLITQYMYEVFHAAE